VDWSPGADPCCRSDELVGRNVYCLQPVHVGQRK
jgi:hypothetical protein